jgi:DNA-binding CsgD family transcriptional regulator
MADELELIAAIYDAVVDPSGWEEVTRRIVEATRSVAGGIFIQLEDSAYLSALCNVDPFYADASFRTDFEPNPLVAAAATIAPGEVRAATYITQTDSFRASTAYKEYFRPQGWADVVAIGLLRGPKSFGNLSLQRSPDAMWVEPKEWHLLETLAPHLKRAAEIHRLLARERAAKESLGAAVAAAGFAVFLLTKDCRVVFANAKGEELLRRGGGLRCANGRLCAATATLSERLSALVRKAAAPDGAEGGTMELPRGEGRPSLIGHVFPLAASRTASIFDIERPAAALFVIDPAASFRAQIERFSARNGLTAAESRVLAEIIGGQGLGAAAARLNITESTAHTHVQRIFSKTGTTRQTELIRRFFDINFSVSSGGA